MKPTESEKTAVDHYAIRLTVKINYTMGYTTPFISAAQQQSIIDSANFAAAKFAKSYTDKIGFRNLFTKEDIEDIAGTTISKACRSFGRFNPAKAKLSTWVYTIAANCVIDAATYKIRRRPLTGELFVENHENGDEFEADECCDARKGFNPMVWDLISEYDADREINREEFESLVRAEISKLGDKNQRFARLLEEGHTPKTMALVEGCTADAAAKRVWVIRQTLKEPVSGIAEEFGISNRKLAC